MVAREDIGLDALLGLLGAVVPELTRLDFFLGKGVRGGFTLDSVLVEDDIVLVGLTGVLVGRLGRLLGLEGIDDRAGRAVVVLGIGVVDNLFFGALVVVEVEDVVLEEDFTPAASSEDNLLGGPLLEVTIFSFFLKRENKKKIEKEKKKDGLVFFLSY